MFSLRLGVPEMEALWKELTAKANNAVLGKAMALLANDPKHPGLHSHEIESLSRRYGIKVWQSYLENKTSGAGRIYRIYGLETGEITIIGLEPHPEDKKKDGYEKVRLSASGKEEA